MQVLHNRIICCIFAVLMLFSGMCLNGNKADDLLGHIPVNSGSVIDSADKELSENRSCTIEMLGIRNIFYDVREVKRPNLRVYTRIFPIFLYADLFTHNICTICIAANTAKLSESYYKTAILSFIHDKDGKK